MSNRILYAYDDAVWEPIYDFDYRPEPQEFTIDPGKYLFMCYGGAGGGTSPTTSWGYGAAAYGVFETDQTETLYAVVGGNGDMYGETKQDGGKGGYNGGGNGGPGKAANGGGGGGGATDIRLTLDEDTIQEPYPDPPPGFPTDWICKEDKVYDTKTYYLYKPIEYLVTHESLIQFDDDLVSITRTSCGISFRRSTYLHPYARYEFDIMLPVYTYNDQIEKSYFFDVDNGQFTLYAKIDNMNYPVIKMRVKTSGDVYETHTYYADIHEPLPVDQKFHVMVENHLVLFSDENGNEINRISFEDYIHGGYGPSGISVEPDAGGRIYHVKTYYKDEPYFEVYPCIRFTKKEEEGPITGYNTGTVYVITDEEEIYYDAGYSDSSSDTRVYPKLTMDTTLNPVHNPVSKTLLSRILVAGGGGGASGSITSVPFKSSSGGGDNAAPIQISATKPIYYGASSMMPINQSTGYKFGYGMDAGHKTMIKQPGNAGAGGGGGGWFGGYSIFFGYDEQNSNTSPPSNIPGTGGSSYAYTATSWTPYGYIPSSRYQLKNPSLIPCQSTQGRAIICKQVKALTDGDRVISVLTGKPTKIEMFPGIYKLKCWGAEGSSRLNSTVKSLGGYTEGILTLTDDIDMYSVVGGSGMFYDIIPNENNPYKWNSTAGFNGGLPAYQQPGDTSKTYVPCGGGATDFRLSLDQTPIHPVDPDIRNDLPTDTVMQLKGFNTQNSNNSRIGVFDTGYKMTPNTRIECDFELISGMPGRGRYAAIFGASSTSALTSADSYGFFVYTNNADKTSLCVGGTFIEGAPITKGTRISLTANANSVTWTDGEITETITSPDSATTGLCNLLVGAMRYDVSEIKSIYATSMIIYKFKIYENNVLVHDFVPSVNIFAAATYDMYDVITNTFATMSGTHALVLFDDNPSKSLMSRIIVAGGGGAQGGGTDNSAITGKGGGTSGGPVGSGSGSKGGPGTQTGSTGNASYPQINAKFGIGGRGTSLTTEFGGGCGGGGWYGGDGVHNISNSSGYCGCGGSGYILTEDSYKPEGYIPDESYYMTEGITTLGGNSELPPTVSKAEIEVIRSTPAKMVIHDISGYKRYNESTQAWEYFSGTINPSLIEEYGVYIIPNLNGVEDEFEVVINDIRNVAENAQITYMPKPQSITFIIPNQYRLSNVTYDVEYNPIKYDLMNFITKYDESHNVYKLTIDKLEETDEELRLYLIQLFAN